jgi:hypothetical protein
VIYEAADPRYQPATDPVALEEIRQRFSPKGFARLAEGFNPALMDLGNLFNHHSLVS